MIGDGSPLTDCGDDKLYSISTESQQGWENSKHEARSAYVKTTADKKPRQIRIIEISNVQKWIPHRVRNDRCVVDSIRCQISPLRPAPIVQRQNGESQSSFGAGYD